MEKERKSLDDFPHFIVSEVQPGETFPTYIDLNLVGTFENGERVTAGVGSLLLPERVALYGEMILYPHTGAALFVSSATAIPALLGTKLPYLSARWQAYHIWMILDEQSRWEKTCFEPADAIQETYTTDDGRHLRKLSKMKPGKGVPDTAQVVMNGWDHEHCELCNEHIDPGDSAYTNKDDLWVCLTCFEKYVGPKDLSFVDAL